jgi:hypothetical protein
VSLPSTYTIAQPIFADSRRDWRLAGRGWAFVCIGRGGEQGRTPELKNTKPGFNSANYRSNTHLFSLEPEAIGKYSGRDSSKMTVPT